ncbi:hypothetical protein MKS88_004738 [Plasmodium brasilianum]|uniref:Uncharacterized protein n=1 Tax=Plasmodium brasilianum TaxID=5824 RepID=A0ACB9Y4B0_PLABR|nr:hypothetical protein MKS88_004738 [Plasmodium brasilianum]
MTINKRTENRTLRKKIVSLVTPIFLFLLIVLKFLLSSNSFNYVDNKCDVVTQITKQSSEGTEAQYLLRVGSIFFAFEIFILITGIIYTFIKILKYKIIKENNPKICYNDLCSIISMSFIV